MAMLVVTRGYITLTVRHVPKIFSLRQDSHLVFGSEIWRNMFKIALSGTLLGKKKQQHQKEKTKNKKNFYSFRQGKNHPIPMKYVHKCLLYKYCYEMGEVTSNRRQSNPFFLWLSGLQLRLS